MIKIMQRIFGKGVIVQVPFLYISSLFDKSNKPQI